MLVESLGRVALHPTHSHTMRIRSQQIAKTEVAVLQAVDAYSAPLVWSAPPTGPRPSRVSFFCLVFYWLQAQPRMIILPEIRTTLKQKGGFKNLPFILEH